MKSVTMPAFEQAFKQQPLMLLDVRESDEFSDGHIEGAISVPLSILSEELARLDKKRVLSCYLFSRRPFSSSV